MRGIMIGAICMVLVLAVGLLVVLGLGLTGVISWSGFGGFATPELVNRQVFTASGLDAISAAYSSESITLRPAEGDEVVLEEYISSTDRRHQANISQSGGRLDITHGDRPAFIGIFGFRAKIILYVPASWDGDLTLKSSSGGIHAEHDISLRSLDAAATSGSVRFAGVKAAGDVTMRSSSGGVSADSIEVGGDADLQATSGSVRMGEVQAAAIKAHSSSGGVSFDAAAAATVDASATSGSVKLGRVEGVFNLESTSGGVQVDGGSGHGHARASSGSVKLALGALTGDLEMRSTSGGCRLELPRDSAFTIEAATTSGSVKLPEGGSVSYNQKGNQASGSYGQSPACKVQMQASSGGVRLEWN